MKTDMHVRTDKLQKDDHVWGVGDVVALGSEWYGDGAFAYQTDEGEIKTTHSEADFEWYIAREVEEEAPESVTVHSLFGRRLNFRPWNHGEILVTYEDTESGYTGVRSIFQVVDLEDALRRV